jgi:hypothetical protein
MSQRKVAFIGMALLIGGVPLVTQHASPCRLLSFTSGQLVTLRGEIRQMPHDLTMVPDGCSEKIVLALPGWPESGLDDPSIGIRFQQDAEYRKFRGVPRGYDIAVTVTGRLDVSDGNERRWDPLAEQLRRGAYGHPIPFTRYQLVMLYISNVVWWPAGTPRPDSKRKQWSGDHRRAPSP